LVIVVLVMPIVVQTAKVVHATAVLAVVATFLALQACAYQNLVIVVLLLTIVVQTAKLVHAMAVLAVVLLYLLH
jgi:hypothetical protein